MEQLSNAIEELRCQNLDSTWAAQMEKTLNKTKNFFKTEYKVLIQVDSDIPDYSLAYALSHKTNWNFQFNGRTQRQKNRRCGPCLELQHAYEAIQEKIDEITDPQQKEEYQYILDYAKDAIFEWQKHIIRTINQNHAKDDLMWNNDEDDVYIHMDWAMKYLVEKYRESQRDWYGKRGLPWHITAVFIRRASDNALFYRFYVHVFDQKKQDANTVIAILQDVLKRVQGELNIDTIDAYV